MIRGVFRYGENEWSELLEDIYENPIRLPNEVALKWRQIKQLMKSDIKRALQATSYEKIITKHEWMIAAIETLEKETDLKREETPQMLYEVLFIDPS